MPEVTAQGEDMHAARNHTKPRRAGGGRRSRWSLAIAGVTLLAVSVVMMATGAQPSRAQTTRPAANAKHLVSLRLPAPAGRYQVGTVSLHLIDRARANPWVSLPPYREMMISVFYPARDADRYPVAPQMLPGAAAHFDATLAKMLYNVPPGKVNWAATLSHAHSGAPVLRDGAPWPVVLYSPGAGDDRTLGTILEEDLASQGYIVVAMDHTYDASEVEFPGKRVVGSVLLQRLATAQKSGTVTHLLEKVVSVRVADTRFVLGSLPDLDAGRDPGAGSPPLPAGLAGALDLNRVGMFGVSGGGFTAAQTMYDDPAIKAGIDIDGTLEYTENATGQHLSTVAQHGLDRPFMLMGSPGTNRNDESSWKSFWEHSSGWRLDVTLKGSDESSYKDMAVMIPQIAKALGLPRSFVTRDIGTVNPAQAVAAEDAYISAFFGKFLKNCGGQLLDGPSPRYPDIIFVR
jgi:Platelet-activating factor acetylhydrolase, isoform II